MNRISRFFLYQRLALRALFRSSPRQSLDDLPVAFVNVRHPSEECSCERRASEVDASALTAEIYDHEVFHFRDCEWSKKMCHTCGGCGYCPNCGGDCIDPRAIRPSECPECCIPSETPHTDLCSHGLREESLIEERESESPYEQESRVLFSSAESGKEIQLHAECTRQLDSVLLDEIQVPYEFRVNDLVRYDDPEVPRWYAGRANYVEDGVVRGLQAEVMLNSESGEPKFYVLPVTTQIYTKDSGCVVGVTSNQLQRWKQDAKDAVDPCMQLSAFLDGEMSDAQKSDFRSHLAMCTKCEKALERDLQVAVILDGVNR